MRPTRERSRVKMAAGSDLLDDVFFSADVDETVVSALVGSLESELTGSGHGAAQPVDKHARAPLVSANSDVHESQTGLARELVNAGSRTAAGVIHGTRSSQGATPDPAAGSGSHADLSTGAANTRHGHKDAAGVATLNGSTELLRSPRASRANALSEKSSALTAVSNGAGPVAVAPAASSTVIQTSRTHAQNASTSTVISARASRLSTGPAVTLPRPPMQTPGTVTAPSGSSNSVVSAGVNVAHVPAANTTAHLSSGANKADSRKTSNQTAAPAPTTSAVASTGDPSLAQPMQSSLQPGTTSAKDPVLPTMTRASVPASITSSAGGIRAVAPVLAPRPPNVQNVQLPPGMVLVRSESGQLLMIHQQTLAQMQAQSQGAMATRPTTPTSTPPVHITSVQVPGTTILTRQVTPTTMIKQGAVVPASAQTLSGLQRPLPLQNSIMVGGTATPPVGAPAGAAPTPVSKETLENVKKCKNFLSTLIKLASSSKQSSETAANVKELVRSLLEGKLEAEDFTSRLYRELQSSPQPYLVPFLKSQLLQTPATSGAGAAQRVPPLSAKTTPTASSTAPPHQSVISLSQNTQNKPNLILQQHQQQGVLMSGPQVSLTQTPMVTLRPGQPRVFAPQTVVKAPPSGTLLKSGLAVGTKLLSGPESVSSAVQRTKVKVAGSSGCFRDDDDINDVASMAGVNLSEESARILATSSELVGAVTRSCKDETFLHTGSLQRRALEIGKKYGVSELGAEVISLVSHATQHRLQDLLGKATQLAYQKSVPYKEDERHEQVSDVRAQLKFFEQMDQMEKQRKEEQERDILLKAAKSRSRQEDPEQLRLKQKAKEMQQQEMAQMRQRDANLTALAAIGPRKKRKVDSLASGSGPEGSGSLSVGSVAGLHGGSRQFTRQRITRVNLRDLLFCLENERKTNHSHLLYKAFLR
ncbi:transcription initiation factor TFIID subunit 4-like isoform X2 [Electrophorus electricus]|uniref:transcription initiation factor TFIID subunit 4-like isoform X2 n=1 Tax=Electrophorus electricus TaxID=8005 RepID=UPI0015CFCD11|nr:transcription initiation factor TFIID subunit 4-like isoform X2 [Electrophorus electricus]